MEAFRAELIADEPGAETLKRLARHFKVSSLVILRRLLDAGQISTATCFFPAIAKRWHAFGKLRRAVRGGGDFYRTTAARVIK